ncbi:hypothetical protein LCGC14_0147050 [marine sediment metagenome]|uniref:Phage terminase large subunit GpA ATPase domain-containing protein n=1 Tax=marine sediment metagenome TaxID=412755 RepID=A0A0F9Y1L1_9ZZZZ
MRVVDRINKKRTERLPVKLSNFVEYAILVDGKVMDFTNRPYLREIYDTSAREILLMCGRQVEKSTSSGNKMLSRSIINSYRKSVYTAPTQPQVRQFSDDRLKEPMTSSPNLAPFTNTSLLKNVFEKRFATRSKITLRSAHLNADRVRGIPADDIYIDEIQDVAVDGIPVIRECAANSPDPKFQYSGTPKTKDNTIHEYWQRSTMKEWMIPCGCKKWYWNLPGEDNIGTTGLICSNCGKRINPLNGQWIRTGRELGTEAHQTFVEGFRIPQIIVPSHQPLSKWIEILNKQRNYPIAKFYNEVLALPFDLGAKPITLEELQNTCDPGRSNTPYPTTGVAAAPTYAGIDWGEGSGEGGFSVLTIGVANSINRGIDVLFIKRYEGREALPEVMIPDMAKYINMYNCNRVGADYGFGFGLNDRLAKMIGYERFFRYQYTGAQREKVRWNDKIGRFVLNRTSIMSYMFELLKRGQQKGPGLRLFKWKDFEPFAKDVLSIFSEENTSLHMKVYSKTPGKPDDTFHSITYMVLVSLLDFMREDFIQSD